jgi:copper chaperone CopZ
VRSALVAVKGVSRATVTLEGHEARVEYDPAQANVSELLAAVERAGNPAAAMTFTATVKK